MLSQAHLSCYILPCSFWFSILCAFYTTHNQSDFHYPHPCVWWNVPTSFNNKLWVHNPQIMLLTVFQNVSPLLASHCKTETSHNILKTIMCWSNVAVHIICQHQRSHWQASCILSDSFSRKFPFPHQAYPVVEHTVLPAMKFPYAGELHVQDT